VRGFAVEARRRLLIVGNGMSTDRLLDELLQRDALRRYDITVVGEEPHGAYNRILLAQVLTGDDPSSIVTKPPSWYEEHGIALLSGRWVQRLDLRAKRAHIGNGQTLAYHQAVLATGSAPALPPVAGLRQSDGTTTTGVHVFRSLDDASALRSAALRPGSRAIVVGAGLLGLEVAKALVDLGGVATVVHPSEHVLNAQVDELGASVLCSALDRLGIRLVTGRAQAVLASAGGADALLLEDGRVLPAEAVIFTTGVRPRIEVAVNSGIEVDRGIVVDDGLATSGPDVFAIGECAEHDGHLVGLVAPCWDQATVLAERLAGTGAATYRAAPSYTRLKVAGVEVASMGLVDAEIDDDHEVQVLERRKGIYRKLVIRHGRLAGAVLVGDGDAAAVLAGWMDRGDRLPDQPLDVLCSAAAFIPSFHTVPLCSCNRVEEATVIDAIAEGHTSVEALGRATRAGTGCGSCASHIRRLLDEAVAAVA
jgi:nitrite reductase (NADH) large subunit